MPAIYMILKSPLTEGRSPMKNDMELHYLIKSPPYYKMHLAKMRFLTTPSHHLSHVVRNDKGLLLRGKRDRAALSQAIIADYICRPAPLPHFATRHCHPESAGQRFWEGWRR